MFGIQYRFISLRNGCRLVTDKYRLARIRKRVFQKFERCENDHAIKVEVQSHDSKLYCFIVINLLYTVLTEVAIHAFEHIAPNLVCFNLVVSAHIHCTTEIVSA